MIRALIILAALALPAHAEEVVAGLSQNRVAITANFDGSEILIFGAVKREVPPPDSGPLQVIITVAGPSEPIVVRRKEHRFGIWVNVDAVEVDAAPSFYAVATSAPFDEVLSSIEDQRYEISINQAIRSVGAPMNISDSMSFTEALIRIRTKAGLYQLKPETVILDEQTLFRTSIALPANLTEGTYKTRIFLTRNGRVIGEYETAIEVSKVGLERWLFNLAHQRPLVYGLLSLFIAIVAGWTASAVFRYLLRG
jgi:uncharacterized protein (TIGR02186 family)